MKKIYFFEKINFFNSFFIFFYKIFFNNIIYYRNSSAFFKKKEVIHFLKLLKIKNINYGNLGFESYFKDLNKENINKTNEILKEIKKLKIYDLIISFLNLDRSGKLKFDILICKNLSGNHLNEGVNTFRFLKLNFPTERYKIFYFPENIGNYILSLKELNYLKPLYFILFIKILIKFIFKKISFNSNKKIDDIKILYSPHQGLKYGNIYKKNFIFQQKYKKNFFVKNILALDTFDIDPVTEKYYKFYKINTAKFPYNQTASFFLFISIYLKNYKEANKNLALFYFLYITLNEIIIFKNFLSKYKNLKVAFFYYDINVNSALVLACHCLNIRTISFQERTTAYSYIPYMFFDEYFISGPRIKNLIKKNYYFFKKINLFSLPRTHYLKNIKSNSILKKKKNLLGFNKFQKLVLCFDIPYLETHVSSNYGNISSSEKRKKFYDDIFFLAKSFKKYNFIIKPKFTRVDDNILNAFKNKIKLLKIPNIQFVQDTLNCSTYKLVRMSDLLFGTYSSVFDECISINKKVLVYDNNFKFYNHPLVNSCLYCKNLNDAKKKISYIFNKKYNYSSDESFLRKYYFNFNKNKDSYSSITTIISKNLSRT